MPLSQRRARLLKRLAVNRGRARESLVLVEGVRATIEALDAGASVSFAVVSPRLDSTEEGRTVRRRLEGEGDAHRALEVVVVGDAEMAEVADTEQPQGVVVVCEEPTASLGEVVAAGSRPSGDGAAGGPSRALRVLVLDAVQDPGNVGTLIRSAVAFSFDVVVALDGTADPWSSKAVRASAGTAFRLAVVRASADDALRLMLGADLPILVASAEGLAGVEPPRGGFALVVGNEGAGVREAVRRAASQTVAVPMTGPAESLNVGIAGSILMSDLTKKDRR